MGMSRIFRNIYPFESWYLLKNRPFSLIQNVQIKTKVCIFCGWYSYFK